MPIKTYENFEIDPMDSILASYARVGIDEKLCLQVLVSPLTEARQKKMMKKVDAIKNGSGGGLRSFIKSIFSQPSDDDKSSEHEHGYSSTQMGDIEKKADDEGFQVVIRGIATSPRPERPTMMMKGLGRSLNQYNYIGLNSFTYLQEKRIAKFAKRFVKRLFSRPYFTFKSGIRRIRAQVLNIKELASIFHFPHNRFNKNPRIVWQKFKIVPAPDNLPTE